MWHDAINENMHKLFLMYISLYFSYRIIYYIKEKFKPESRGHSHPQQPQTSWLESGWYNLESRLLNFNQVSVLFLLWAPAPTPSHTRLLPLPIGIFFLQTELAFHSTEEVKNYWRNQGDLENEGDYERAGVWMF